MQKLTVNPQKAKPHTYYLPDERLAYQLEQHILKKGVSMIGDPHYWDDKRFEDGTTRPSCLSMDERQRATRTDLVKQMSLDEVMRMHHFERTKDRFLCVGEMRLFHSNLHCQFFTDDQVDVINKFQDENKPSPRYYDGLQIPRGFIYDWESDAMAYHQAWDLLLHKAYFKVPEKKGTGYKSMFEDGE